MLAALIVACLGTLPYTLGGSPARFDAGTTAQARDGPLWAGGEFGFMLGSDALGRSLLLRLMLGGAISLAIGLSAAAISVAIGTTYGMLAGYFGGRLDAFMMRIVDVLYGLPTTLLVLLLAVASDAAVDNWVNRYGERRGWVETHAVERMHAENANEPTREYLRTHPAVKEELERAAAEAHPPRVVSRGGRVAIDLGTLLIAIAGMSWLTLARVVRAEVLSLKSRPFVEAARAMGASHRRILLKHLLPNLVGVIAVYGALAVPQAILQESFLSFLGVGVKPPMPSWGTLAAEGLPELNPYKSHWWLLAFPCVLLGLTLLSLNILGEWLRVRLDPKRAAR